MSRGTHRSRRKAVAFSGSENDSLFAPYLRNDVSVEFELIRDASADALRAVQRLVRAGCPEAALVTRLFAVVLGYVYEHKPARESRVGGLTGKQISRLTDRCRALADEVTTTIRRLLSASPSSDPARGSRLLGLAQTLARFAADLTSEYRDRLTQRQPGPTSSFMPMYLTGLCDFVLENTGHQHYELLGVILEDLLTLYVPSHENDGRFSQDAIKKAITRYRRAIP